MALLTTRMTGAKPLAATGSRVAALAGAHDSVLGTRISESVADITVMTVQ